MALTNMIQIKDGKKVLTDIEGLKTELNNSKLTVVKDTFKITNPALSAQKVFALTGTPISVNSIEFFLNGINYDTPDISYNALDNTVTWVSEADIDLADADVVIRYNTVGNGLVDTSNFVTKADLKTASASDIQSLFTND